MFHKLVVLENCSIGFEKSLKSPRILHSLACMNHVRKQSDVGAYCLQYKPLKYISRRESRRQLGRSMIVDISTLVSIVNA